MAKQEPGVAKGPTIFSNVCWCHGGLRSFGIVSEYASGESENSKWSSCISVATNVQSCGTVEAVFQARTIERATAETVWQLMTSAQLPKFCHLSWSEERGGFNGIVRAVPHVPHSLLPDSEVISSSRLRNGNPARFAGLALYRATYRDVSAGFLIMRMSTILLV